MAKPAEIEFKDLPFINLLASYNVFGKWSPAVYKSKNDDTYSIRIAIESSYNNVNGRSSHSWNYFTIDTTGLIIESPRTMGKMFTKKFRITNMPEFVEAYKDIKVNE